MQYPSRQRVTDHSGDGNCRHKPGDDLGTPSRREPVSQIKNDAWKKTSLGKSKQEPHGIKRGDGIHEKSCSGDNSPGDHDAGNPQTCADLFQQQIAGYLEDQITKEKNARSKALNRVAERQIVLHLQLGEAHIDTIEIGGDVTNKEQRQQTQRDLGINPVGRSGGDLGGNCHLAGCELQVLSFRF